MTLRTVANSRLVDGVKLDNLPADTNTSLAGKQATLISGTNIKTINGSSVLGSGDLVTGGAVDSVNGQTGVVVVDADDIDDTSTANKFVTSSDITKLGNLSGTNTGDVTVSDTSEIDISLTGQQISASIVASSIDESKLDASVNASLDLADSALQANQTITLSGDVTGSGTTGITTTIGAGAVDIAMLSATGTPSGTTYLRGDNTWATISGGGDVSKVGTPVDNQIGVWTGDGTIEGTSGLTYTGTDFNVAGDLNLTGSNTPNFEFGISNAAANIISFDAPNATSQNVQLRLFRLTNTSGASTGITIHSADGTGGVNGFLSAKSNSYMNNTAGNFGVGIVTGLAKLHTQATTEQFRASYDASNYFSITVGSAGGVTFDAVGSGALFTFSDDVRITTPGTNTASVVTVGGTQTLTGKTLTSPVINVTSDATGDIYYRDAGGLFTRLPIGSTDNVLKVSGGLPSRGAASGGGFWTTVPGTPTRVSDTVFTVTDTANAGLYDQLLQRGTVLKWTQSGTKQAMVVSATYAANVVTVTLIGDTFAAGFSDVKYGLEKARMFKFALAGTIGATGTNVANTQMAECPIKIYGCDVWAGTAGSGTTTFDINKNGTTFFTTKPSILTTGQNILGVTADTGTTAATGDYLTLDVDATAGTTKIIDAYVNLYYMPLYMANLA